MHTYPGSSFLLFVIESAVVARWNGPGLQSDSKREGSVCKNVQHREQHGHEHDKYWRAGCKNYEGIGIQKHGLAIVCFQLN